MLPPTAPVSRLRGVGARLADELASAGIERIADLFWLLPIGYDDFEHPCTVSEAVGRAAERPHLVVRGEVKSAGAVFVRRRRATRVVLGDPASSAKLTLWWFFAAHGVLGRAEVGAELIAVGRVAHKQRGALMAHPDVFRVDAEAPRVRPRYPRAGASAERIRALVAQALTDSEIPELCPAPIAERERFEPLAPLLRELHQPAELPPVARIRAAHEPLAWAEAFCRVLGRRLRQRAGERPAAPIAVRNDVTERLEQELGFAWTAGQAAAIADIAGDLGRSQPMRRLIVGDVASGKTAVALAALAAVVSAGRRGIVFAPTGVLAEQYRIAAEPLVRATGARLRVLTAKTAARERLDIERALAAGEIDVLVGTHALLDQALVVPDLALVIVDEQQRFGVAQRLAIVEKGETSPHVLTLSATPIPRTLALSLRGEVATSTLDDLPPGRTPPETELCPRSRYDDVVLPAIEAALERGEGTFVVCPRIGDKDDDEEDDGDSAAVSRHAALAARFGADRVALAHGRLPRGELGRALERFRAKDALVLVGTSVIEVGIDVPHATLVIVDGAEHFGLSDLHQLRGRVGRAELGSRCVLVHSEPLVDLARTRLEALVALERGADIARRDLELRGAGDLAGTRQSGASGVLFLDAFADAPWLERIEDDVDRVLAEDPRLERHPGLALFALRMLSALRLTEDAA